MKEKSTVAGDAGSNGSIDLERLKPLADLSIERILTKTDSVLGIYTISRKPETRNHLIPYFWLNFTEDRDPPEIGGLDDRARSQDWYSSAKYVAYLADKRNRAVELLLEKCPETTDIMCIDSYYIPETD